jgi:dipeptidyl aminopeptidase/acylaminoacyl peptidase
LPAASRRSSRRSCQTVDYIEYGGEGHGWHMLQTNLDFWGRVERFLAEHIGK